MKTWKIANAFILEPSKSIGIWVLFPLLLIAMGIHSIYHAIHSRSLVFRMRGMRPVVVQSPLWYHRALMLLLGLALVAGGATLLIMFLPRRQTP